MLRRPRAIRRTAALLTPLALVAALTAACGEETTVVSGAREGTEAFELTGEPGSSPELSWKSRMTAEDPETEVVTEGDGDPLADGDEVLVDYYVGNGFTQQTTLDTYGEDQTPTVFPVGGDVPQPASAQPSDADVARYLLDVFVADQVEADDTVGTRKVATVSAADILGVAGSILDVGNEDALVVVIDIAATVKSGPDGSPIKERDPWVPAIGFKDGSPTQLDFSTTPAPNPDGVLKKAVLYQGTGAKVGAKDLVVVNYLGQVYDGAKPFDSSFGKGTFTTALGRGAVIKGWDQGLVGLTVGSRVMLQIPPRFGYGKDGSGEAIPGNSTLYFVIDVLAAG